MNQVTFQVRIETTGEQGVKNITVDAEQMSRALNEATGSASKFNTKLLDINQASMAFQNLFMGIQMLSGQVKGLTEAWTRQEMQEVKLLSVMRQRMGATSEDINSIKKLASAQQELGVVGDEVLLAGSAQIGTFVNQRSSLEQLMPALNALITHNKGLNATVEDGVQLGNLMGKAMQGHAAMLVRVGVTLTDEQQKIINHGNETQRAAALSQAIMDNYGKVVSNVANTSAGKAKQMSNAFDDMKESLGSVMSSIEPVLEGFSEFGMFVFSLMQIKNGIKAIASANLLARAASMAHTAAVYAETAGERIQAQARTMLTAVTGTATVSTLALRTATIALMAVYSMGLSLVITGVVALISNLIGKENDASDSTDKMSEAAERARQEEEQERSAIEQTRSALAINIAKLKEFKGSKEQEKSVVEQMNSTYGETMGIYQSVSEWYKVLTANSGLYCQQLINQARIQREANQVARIEEKLDMLRAGKSTPKYIKDTASGEVGSVNPQYTQDINNYTNALNILHENMSRQVNSNARLSEQMKTQVAHVNYTRMSYVQLGEAIDAQKSKVEGLIGVDDKAAAKESALLKQMESRYGKMNKQYGLSDSGDTGKSSSKDDKIVSAARSYADLSHNIEVWQKALDKADPSDRKTVNTLMEHINTAKLAKKGIEDMRAAYDTPAEPKTLEEYDAALQRQEELRKRATSNNIGNIDKEIAKLKEQRSALEESGTPIRTSSEVKTYADIEAAIGRWQSKLQTADSATRPALAEEIKQLESLRDAWQRADASANKPAGTDKLNTLREIDDALSYYERKMQDSSIEELSATQREIDRLQQKRTLLQSLASLHSSQSDLGELGGMTGKDVTIRLKEIGIEGIEKKIRELQKLMKNTDVSLGNKKEIQKQVNEWTKYEAKLKKSQVTFRGAWSAVKNVGNGIQSLSNALKGNGSAWDKMTAVVDAGIAIFEGIAAVIQIVKALTAATTAEQTAEAGVKVAANTAEAASWQELAASEFFAAYAYIPFGGEALAAKDIGLMKGVLSAVALAQGGVLYGPTLALMGEYAGASGNPEVVAPLDKLKNLLGDSGGGKVTVEVKSKLRGRDIVLSGKREMYRRSRS